MEGKTLIDYMMEGSEPPSFLLKLKWKIERIADVYYKIKYFFQKIFRKHHTSDPDIWNLSTHLAEIILHKLIAFKKYPRRGYPPDFSEYFEDEWESKEEYEKEIEKGNLLGGGPDAWEKVIDEMIFAFDFLSNYDGLQYCGTTKEVLDRWNLKYPHNKTEENKKISYIYRNEEGLLVSSTEKLEEDNYEYLGEDVSFYNFELEREYYDRAYKGLELFAKHFMGLND